MQSAEPLAELYRKLYTIRAFETQAIRLYRQGLIRGYLHPCIGQEAVAVGVCAALEERDYIVSTHRGHGHCIARGADLKRMMAELFGRETGYCRGRGGSMHIADVGAGNLGANGIVGAGIPLGVGAALGSKIRGEDRVTAVFFSDGATNNGVFAEALNLAAIWDLPVVLALENNQYAVGTPIEDVSRTEHLAERVGGYGVEGCTIDGNDVIEVYEAAGAAAYQCRDGKGPVLVECMTYRQMGHHVNDPGDYMPRDRLEYYKSRDPITVCEGHLRGRTDLSDEDIAQIRTDVDAELEAAIEFAGNSPKPDVEAFLAEVDSWP